MELRPDMAWITAMLREKALMYLQDWVAYYRHKTSPAFLSPPCPPLLTPSEENKQCHNDFGQ